MKAIFKTFLIILIAGTFIFGIAACNFGNNATNSIANIDTLKIKGNVKFTTFGLDNGECPAALSFVDKFNEKYPDVKVDIDIITASQLGSRDARIAAGDIGDVYWIGCNEVYTYAVTQQACVDLNFYLNQLNVDTSNVYKGMYHSGVVNGKLYMVARDHNHVSITYNRDALKNEGLSDPKEDWTWNDFKDYCKKLTKTDDGGVTYTQVGSMLNVEWQPVWMAFAQGWGGTLYDTVNKRINLISDNKVYEGLNEMYTLMEEGYMKQIGAKPDKYPNWIEGVNSVFTNIVYPGIDAYGRNMEQNGVDWDFANFPITPTHSVGTGATGHVVYSGSKNKLAAAALCTYFFTDEGQLSYNNGLGGSVPLVKSLADAGFWKAPYVNKNYDVFVSYPESDIIGELACKVPKPVSDLLLQNIMTKIYTDALSGKTSLADGLKNAETKANEKWAALAKT